MGMTIAQIVESESGNTDRIHLYREGLFLKAYNRSAFLFQKYARSFKPVKKYYKSVGADVVMLGFPSANLSAVFPDGDFESADAMHVCVACPGEINLREYEAWLGTVEALPEKPKKETHRAAPQPVGIPAGMHVSLFDRVEHLPTPGREVIDRVAQELEAFSIENSTPMECMMFLSRLKTELKKGKNSGGL